MFYCKRKMVYCKRNKRLLHSTIVVVDGGKVVGKGKFTWSEIE